MSKFSLASLVNIKIRTRLILGFSGIVLILVLSVGFTTYEVGQVENSVNLIVKQRVPTAAAISEIESDINLSLATLRGWMLTGNPSFNIGRAAAWHKISEARQQLDILSKIWTNPENVTKWLKFKKILLEFEVAQEKVETIANSPEQFPATLILVNEAAPKASIIVREITSMIDEEQKLEATSERKALLGIMADVRGTMGMILANIRAYLLTGDEKFINKYSVLQAKNTKRFGDLESQIPLLTASQKSSFEKLSAARKIFSSLPEKMFSIRNSKKYNMANFILLTEAAPRANSLLTILTGEKDENGARNGGMVSNQQDLLYTDGDLIQKKISDLKISNQVLLVIGLIISAVVAMLTARSIVIPINLITNGMKTLAEGDLETEIPAQNRQDEIGNMALALQTFKENAIDAKRVAAQAEEANKQVEAEKERQHKTNADREEKERQDEALRKETADREKREMMKTLADEFESSVGDYVSGIANAATELNATSTQMVSTADSSLELSENVADGARNASINVQTVASAAEELTSSISEISRQVQNASRTSSEAVTQAQRSNKSVSALADTSRKISEIINIISDIASQTNLLALNATIEAARVGEAGKGFAVVASEVKSLATQTAKSTEEIAEQIKEMQEASEDAVSAIETIGGVIGSIQEATVGISSAIEEQSAATNEISRNVQEASNRTDDVSSKIGDVSTRNSETGEAAKQLQGASTELDKLATNLQTKIADFMTQLRAA